MDYNKIVASELRDFNKWRRGKGKKYQSPGFPFDPKKIGEDIDHAVKILSLQLPKDNFITLSAAGKATLLRLKDIVKEMKKNGQDTAEMQLRIDALSEAVKGAEKIIRKFTPKV